MLLATAILQMIAVIAMVLFLQDVLTVLHKVSLKFQEEKSVVADISVCIKTTISRIKALEKRYILMRSK